MRLRIMLVFVGLPILVAVSSDPAQAIGPFPLPSYRAVALDSPAPQAGAQFGNTVAVIGDVNGDGVNDIAVASTGQNSGAVQGAGIVWIFSGRTRKLIRTIPNPNPAGTGFGDSIIELGDVNGDGVPDLAIAGAYQDVPGHPGQGRVYIFSGATGALIRTVNDPTPQDNANFGTAMVPTGDLNHDGSPDFVVSAPGENVGICISPDPNTGAPGTTPGPCPVGAAYAIDGKTGATIHRFDDPEKPAAANGFGSAAMSSPGDVTRDGVNDVVIGAPFDSTGGRAFLFDGRTGALVRTLQPPAGSDPGGGFGFGVGSGIEPGDVNGDGIPDILAAAPGQGSGGAHNAGRLYVLSGKDGSIIRTLNDPHPKPGGSLGFLQAGAGDLNGDGTPDILAARPTFSARGYLPDPQPGAAAYVFDGRTGKVLVSLPGMTLDGPGSSIASPGDLNGDGYPDYILGGRLLDAGAGPQSGRVIFELSTPPRGRPVVTRFRLTNNPFVVSRAFTPPFATVARHKKGTKITYTLSKPATVRIVFTLVGSGSVQGRLTRRSHRGVNLVAFSGRIGAKALRSGRYRATLIATDPTRQTSKPRTIFFKIVAT